MPSVFNQLFHGYLIKIGWNYSLYYLFMTLTVIIIHVKAQQSRHYNVLYRCEIHVRIAILAYIGIRYEPPVSASLTSRPEAVTWNTIFIAYR